MKKILITGTDGFIGSQLLLHFENLGNHKVFTINEDLYKSDTWVEDIELILNSVSPDVIFHVGACSDTLEQRVNYMMTLNFESTKILTDYSKKYNVPIIYSSSAANYGTNNKYPSNLYGWSKYVAEQYVISNGGIALRYFNVYGPGEDNKGRMASVAFQMFKKCQKGDQVFLFPKKPLRDFVYVKDVVSANLYAWEKYDKLNGNYYEVGSGEAKGFEDVLNYMNIEFDYTDESMIPEGYQFYTCSNKKKWMENWEPFWSLEKGIKDYKKYLQNESI